MLKISLIQDAYSQIEVSGLTRKPTPDDISLALSRLEGMAAELAGRNICVGYNFTSPPDPNDEAGIELQFQQAFASNLALRMLSDFGITPHPSLVSQARQSMSNMSARTAQLRDTQYPSRMPIGSGNTRRWQNHRKFYTPARQAPQSCDTRRMDVGEVNDFAETWLGYLDFASGEEISTYTFDASAGLLVTDDSLDSPIISFRVEAQAVGYQNIIFTITTTTGRIDRREAPFDISDIVEAQSNA